MNLILKKQIEEIVEKRALEIPPQFLDKIFNHHTTATLAGAGLGAGVGALTDDDDPLRGAAIGAGAGGLGGLGLSHALPEQSAGVNNFLVKHLLRKPVGRVVTNTITPVGYDPREGLVGKHSIKDIIKSIWNDKPVYEKEMFDQDFVNREVPYRKAFDLKPRYGQDIYNEGPKGLLSFNKKNRTGLVNILETLDPRRPVHSVLKNYHRNFTPEGGVDYSDVWDWELNPNNDKEKINNIPNLARYFINRIAKPQTIAGSISPQEANLYRKVFDIPAPQLQKNSSVQDKQAFLGSIISRASKDADYAHTKVIPFLDKLLSHHTGTALAGAGVGGLAGGLLTPKGSKLKGMLGGAAAGGGLGLGASYTNPEQSKALNNFLVSNLVRKPIGRAFSNWVEPAGAPTTVIHPSKIHTKPNRGLYSHLNDTDTYGVKDKLENIKKTPVKKLLRSYIKDEPIYKMPEGTTDEQAIRDFIQRKTFDLPPRVGQDLLIPNSDGSYSVDLETPFGEQFKSSIQQGLPGTFDYESDMVGKPLDAVAKVLRRYQLVPTKENLQYQDTWDYNLHRNEPLNKSNLIRYLVNKVIKPVELKGSVPKPW